LKTAPEFVSDFLREYYDVVASAIFRQEGVVDKFIGDGVMALFGVFSQPEDDPGPPAVASVRAASEVRTAFDQGVSKWKLKWERKTVGNC
jgi:adenylate cyclase